MTEDEQSRYQRRLIFLILAVGLVLLAVMTVGVQHVYDKAELCFESGGTYYKGLCLKDE